MIKICQKLSQMNPYVGEDGTLQSSSLSNEEEKEGGSGGGFY